MTDDQIGEIHRRLAELSSEDRRRVLAHLRVEFPVHDLERQFGVPAEVVLEAISRSADLTRRGILGVIAEAIFATEVLPLLNGWSDVTPAGNHAFDFELSDGAPVHVQLKNQRREKQVPKLSPSGRFYVVETQRTRGGQTSTGEKTRPYRFGEFDILAVCMQPSTGKWTDFYYTVQRWLTPDRTNVGALRTMQYIPREPNADWTTDFIECVRWFRSGLAKSIADDIRS
jgi:hypothetical protein